MAEREPNDGRFPDDSEVLVRYPLRQPQMPADLSDNDAMARLKAERETWPWLTGTIERQCGPDEWLVTIEERSVATLEDGSPAPDGTPGDDLFFPQCFRDASEIRKAGATDA